jgi:hypothetical protein
MEHDNSGFRPGWFLEKVEIVNQATSSTSVFPCQRWLDKDKDDGQIRDFKFHILPISTYCL